MTSSLAAYTYMGTSRRVAVEFANGVNQTSGSGSAYPGLDRFGRIADLYYALSGAPVHRYENGYDLAGNRTHARVTQATIGSTPHVNDRSWSYGYDGLQRLMAADMGELDGSNLVAFPPAGSAPLTRYLTWGLDALGNWSGNDTVASGLTQWDVPDGGPPAAAAVTHGTNNVNEITTLSVWGQPDQPFVHDPAGNHVFDGSCVYQYDAWNRLTEINQAGSLTVNDFDSDGRIATSPDPIGSLVAQFAYDALGRLIWAWEPYGRLAAIDLNATPRPINLVGHQGLFFYRFDTGPTLSPDAIGLYHNRNRWYAPTLSRFTTQDPNESGMLLQHIFYTGSMSPPNLDVSIDRHYANGINLYQYLSSRPIVLLDSSGLIDHHLYPLYLGGAPDGTGIDLDKPTHDAFHTYLRRNGYNYGDAGRQAWASLEYPEHQRLLEAAARHAGIDTSDPVFVNAMNEAMADAISGTEQLRQPCRKVYKVTKVKRNIARRLVSRICPGLDNVSALGKGMAAVGGVLYGLNMMESLSFTNPHTREIAIVTQKTRKRGGSTSVMDEVTVLDNLYQITGDPFSAAYGWEYWRHGL